MLYVVQNFIETCVVTSPLFEEEDGSSKYVQLSEQVVDIPVSRVHVSAPVCMCRIVTVIFPHY